MSSPVQPRVTIDAVDNPYGIDGCDCCNARPATHRVRYHEHEGGTGWDSFGLCTVCARAMRAALDRVLDDDATEDVAVPDLDHDSGLDTRDVLDNLDTTPYT